MLDRGKTNTVQLSNHMLEGRDSWLKWHRYYAQTLSPKIEQVCLTAKPLLIRLMSWREATLYTQRSAVSSSLNRLIQVPPRLDNLLGALITEEPIKEVLILGVCFCRRT